MLEIEDGTAKENAQSYATAAELVAYAAARGITIPATEPEQEALLLKAMDYLESLSYIGNKYSYEQALLWPRYNVTVEGFDLYYYQIPANLKKAQLQLAIDAQTIDLMANVMPNTTGAVLEKRVEGAVSIKYASPGSTQSVNTSPDGTVLTQAYAYLNPLLKGMTQLRVGRG